MKKLKLPIIRGELPPARHLSMNEYFKFVQWHLKYRVHKKNYEEWRETQLITVPFSLGGYNNKLHSKTNNDFLHHRSTE